jgi:hypothetical protein
VGLERDAAVPCSGPRAEVAAPVIDRVQFQLTGMNMVEPMRHSIKVALFDGEDGWPDKAREFVAWLTALIEQAPEELRDKIEIDIGGGASYDCGYVEIAVYYDRLETDETAPDRSAKSEPSTNGSRRNLNGNVSSRNITTTQTEPK